MYTLIISAGLLFGPGCDSGCPVLTGHETPVGQHWVAPAAAWQGFYLLSDDSRRLAIHGPTDSRRRQMLESGVAGRPSAGCINMLERDLRKLPRKRFVLTIRP